MKPVWCDSQCHLGHFSVNVAAVCVVVRWGLVIAAFEGIAALDHWMTAVNCHHHNIMVNSQWYTLIFRLKT